MVDINAEIARLTAENAAMKAKLEQKAAARPITFKVSDKGAVSAYGLGRFPVTLYGSQWTRLAAHMGELTAFLAENADKLATKPVV
jgi:hypothetical protein